MYNVRRIIKLIPIIWGFFIFNSYGQKVYYTIVKINKFIEVEMKFRTTDVLERIEIEDLNKKKTYTVICHENDYTIDTDEKQERFIFNNKTIQLNELKEKGGKLKFNIKVISKSGKPLYIKQFNPSFERTKKVIKIKFI